MAAAVSAQEPPKEAPAAPTGDPAAPPGDGKQDKGSGYICGADIFYEWEVRFPAEGRGKPDPAPRVYETFYSRAEESGEKKDELIAAITSHGGMYESKALEHCRDERQTVTNCVAHKLRDIEQDYRRADYASRSALLQSVIGDCKGTQGICTKARLGEVTCAPRPAPPPPAPTAPVAASKK